MTQTATKLNTSAINQFIQSVDEVFTTMLDMKPKRIGLQVSKGERLINGVSTLVGISGAVSGVVVLHFSEQTAIALACRFADLELDSLDAVVVDAISELTNMVAGAAKAKVSAERPSDLSLPSVVEGKDYRLKYPSKSVWVEVPFECEAGPFAMELTFDTSSG